MHILVKVHTETTEMSRGKVEGHLDIYEWQSTLQEEVHRHLWKAFRDADLEQLNAKKDWFDSGGKQLSYIIVLYLTSISF